MIASPFAALCMGMWAVLGYGVLSNAVVGMPKRCCAPASSRRWRPCRQLSLAGCSLGMFPALLFMVLRGFLSSLERAGIHPVRDDRRAACHALLLHLHLGHFGAPALGIVGAAISALAVNTLSFVLLYAYIQIKPETRGYEIFVRFWRSDWPVLKEVVKLGLPIAVTILAEVSLFTVASLLMGMIGTVELAAHGIALQFASIAFMVPLGLAQVATVRIGLAHGRRDAEGSSGRRSRCSFSAAPSPYRQRRLALFSHELAALYLDTRRPDAAQVLAYAGPLIVIAGAFQLVDGVQALAAGMLRGLKDTTVPMILALLSYWAIGFFPPAFFAFPPVSAASASGTASCSVLPRAGMLAWRFFLLSRERGVNMARLHMTRQGPTCR